MKRSRYGFIPVLGFLIATTSILASTVQPSSSGRHASSHSGPDCDGPTVCYSFETIDQGQHSGFGSLKDEVAARSLRYTGSSSNGKCYAEVANPQFEAIIREERLWADFWEEHTSTQFRPPPLPEVDFEQFVVVVAISGTRTNDCFGMEIAAISEGPCDTRRIHVREEISCGGPCGAA